MELLQKYLFIPLDIFQQNKHNGNIRDKRDAWLTLFSSDDPDTIIELMEEYPEFRQIYEEAYEICLNVERVIDMFSKELYELDKNTVQYMIDEMQETIDEQKDKIGEQQDKIEEQQSMIDKQKQKMDEIQESHANAINKIQEEHVKEMDEIQKYGIRNAVKILQDLKVPEQEIRTRICELYQISEEQVGEFLNQENK